MKDGSGAVPAPRRRLDERWPSFGTALGHRLRRVREDARLTAQEVSDLSSTYGLGWDRTIVSRVERGSRQVSAVELMALGALYRRSVADLLPTEPCRLTDRLGAEPTALRDALMSPPDYVAPAGSMQGALVEAALPALRWAHDRYPGTAVRWVGQAEQHAHDAAVVKAASRLAVDPLDVAVGAVTVWGRDLVTERDERVGVVAGEGIRARQARRGHVTRMLLDELRPALEALRVRRGQADAGSERDEQGSGA